MKFTHTIAAVAVYALVNNVSAVKLRDIFDSYDEETKKEAANKDKEENVDPAALAKEINGEQIKAEVKSATADVANQSMVQTGAKLRIGFIDDVESIYVANEDVYLQRNIIDKDGDGVEDNEHLTHHELDRFIKPWVYGDVEEMHNTRNGELPGHHRADDHPEPKGYHASHIPDLRDKQASSAQVVADAIKNGPKEEEKPAAPAAAEGEAKKEEAKPAEDKKVQILSQEDDGSDIDASGYVKLVQKKITEQVKPAAPKKVNGTGGPEQNLDLDANTLDRFNQDIAFGHDIRDIFNTAHGGIPGHVRANDDPAPEWHSSQLAVGIDRPGPRRGIPGEAFMNNQAIAARDIAAQQAAAFKSEVTAVDITNSARLANYVVQIQGPEDLAQLEDEVSLLQVGWKRGKNKIYDADGDGVEDNTYFDHFDLDKFEIPNVFNTAEEIFNTRNGELPGHFQKEFYDMQSEPEIDPSAIIQGDWARK